MLLRGLRILRFAQNDTGGDCRLGAPGEKLDLLVVPLVRGVLVGLLGHEALQAALKEKRRSPKTKTEISEIDALLIPWITARAGRASSEKFMKQIRLPVQGRALFRE